ncbi:MAG: hypothetical protein MR456_04035 [Spirochaetia bacterium]|nr:hypothetical protein [Spirochaetia bacterium]
MKISLKNSLIILSAALAVLFTGCASTPKGLTPSQAVGANHSPAALYKVSVSGNAKSYTASKAREQVSNYLQVQGGFTFVDQNRVNEIYANVKQKAEKKAKRKNVTDAIFGKKSILDAITADTEDEAVFYASDIYKAISKELKCKYFVKVNVKAGIATFWKKGDLEKPIKPLAETTVYIYNKKAELKKEIHAIYASPVIDMATIQNKSEVTNLFPDLIEKSISLAAENLNKKEKLFEINILKPETIELVTNSETPASISTWE